MKFLGRSWASRVAMAAMLFNPAPPEDPQAAQAKPSARLRVFLDCGGECFSDYLRDEIKFVDFVHQPQDADVHVLASVNQTGGGGRETVLRFVGRGRFAGHDEEFRAVSLSGDTENTRRAQILQTVQVALLGFAAREGLPAGLTMSVEAGQGAATQKPVDDPWNAWIFSVRGSTNYDKQETQHDHRWNFEVGADRITQQWKITAGVELGKSVEEFDFEDEDAPLKAVRENRQGRWFVAYSLGPHWSAGLQGHVESSTFGNTKFAWATAPGVEYNVFPYADYATRQLRLNYFVGVRHARYNEITLYDKLAETHPVHEASSVFSRREPWGSIDVGFQFTQYLHDLSKYRLEVNGEASFRITRGLTVNLEAGASRLRDQISIPRRDATQEEVLLRLRELQSGFRVAFDVGFTYSFGSLFNNVVNPRFGR